MSFLQINNPDGTSGVKRPFRLSDIQDIWNGIKSLFKAISGQQFRIISGFDLANGTYTSGTVWYNNELYEYDSTQYPITRTTAKVSFGSVAQDDRVWEGGDTLPFSSRFVCGGDGYNGAVEFTDFVANIEKYKSYLGGKSVTNDKLADKCVSDDKLADNCVTLRTLASPVRLLRISGEEYEIDVTNVSSDYVVINIYEDLVDLQNSIIRPVRLIGTPPTSFRGVNLNTGDYSGFAPSILPLLIRNSLGVSVPVCLSGGDETAIVAGSQVSLPDRYSLTCTFTAYSQPNIAGVRLLPIGYTILGAII